ncbi:MAG: tRNA (N6-threonylcarbamoyladenosine(37)-N6)-methyltransferase TrmO [candidate division Zixibacteria bacterium]|nr:tRNA (N6-threonylcarbamoyladenosine(37)-N6)-methyltransferase TrmO [candidate division Zixibacteria bacterium]
MSSAIVFQPIGIIHTPFSNTDDCPIQPRFARDVAGQIEMLSEFVDGLTDLGGFSHLVLLFQFHLSEDFSLRVKPYLDDTPRGVFATRAPRRPNALGMSIVRLERVAGPVVHIRDVDMVDGTPLLDIKPYVPELNPDGEIATGWLGKKMAGGKRKTDRSPDQSV